MITSDLDMSNGIQSSRSTKVLVQLQQNWETLQKELASTKAQLEAATQAKQQFQLQAQEHADSNTQYRSDVQNLMRILDTKQQQLNSTKRASQTMEQQVKQLKHEAHVLRKQLDSAQTLHRTEAELKLWQEQRVKILQESLATRREREKRQLEHDLHQIVTLMNRLACSHELLSRMYEVECIQLAKELAEENGIVPEHSAQMQRKKEELVAFAASALEQLQELTAAVDSSVDINMESTVLACRTKVDDLIRRIRTYSATEAQTNS